MFVSKLLDDRDLRAVDRDSDSRDQNNSEHDVLGEDVDAKERHANSHHRNDQRPDQRAPDAADPPGDRGAANDHSRDRGQQQLGGERRRATRKPSGQYDAGQRREAAGQNEGDDLLPADLDARSKCRRFPGADGGAVATETRMCLQDVRDMSTIRPIMITPGTPNAVPVIQFWYERSTSGSMIERSPEMTRAELSSTPPIASVAMKDGIFSRTCAIPESDPR